MISVEGKYRGAFTVLYVPVVDSNQRPLMPTTANRARGGIPPSTKARWNWKLRIINWLKKMFPITIIVVEDIKAWSKKNQKKWNSSFSPLEVGKKWFYQEVRK